jgi:hypothetical protein
MASIFGMPLAISMSESAIVGRTLTEIQTKSRQTGEFK